MTDETIDPTVNPDEAQAVAAAADPAREPEVEVVTTALGTFGVEGVALIGTRRSIPLSAYSENWMRPANAQSAARIKKHLQNRASLPR